MGYESGQAWNNQPVAADCRKHAARLPLVLWPPAQDYFDEILVLIRDRLKVGTALQTLAIDGVVDYQLGSHFEAVARSLYATESVSQEKLDTKLGAMRRSVGTEVLEVAATRVIWL